MYYQNSVQNSFAPIDMSEIKGNDLAKFGMEVAACGGHNVFMLGSAGSGKTMLAKSMNSILPPLNQNDSLDVSSIYSIAGIFLGNSLIKNSTFLCTSSQCYYAFFNRWR